MLGAPQAFDAESGAFDIPGQGKMTDQNRTKNMIRPAMVGYTASIHTTPPGMMHARLLTAAPVDTETRKAVEGERERETAAGRDGIRGGQVNQCIDK